LFRWLYLLSDWLRDKARRKQWDADLALGRRGEDLAHRFLQKHGYTVVARNYRTATGSGELDIVAAEDDGGSLVMVEVKTRTSTEFGTPERNVNREKERRMLRAAEDFARRSDVPLERVRFDVVTVVMMDKRPEIRHLRDVFHPDDAA
jgi:putative endonuclease